MNLQFNIKFQFFIIGILLLTIRCNTTNQLELHKNDYYKEKTHIELGSEVKLFQKIAYNHPKETDKYWTELSFTLKDTLRFIEKQTFDLTKDTAIVSCKYGYFTNTDWKNYNYKISGTLTLIEWKIGCIILKEDILVEDFKRKEKKWYKGYRTFEVTP
jgi:hypothetical protein